MLGRSSKSLNALRKAAIYVQGSQGDRHYTGAINRLSEYEMQIIWDPTSNPPKEGPINLVGEDFQDQNIVFKATIVSTYHTKDLWISEVVVNEMQENEFNAFLELVYDRIAEPDSYRTHSIPSEVFRYIKGRISKRRERF